MLQRKWIDSLPTVYDVPSDDLIARIREYLKMNVPDVAPPDWASFAKTSSHLEEPPVQRDWWYTRCASLLRKTYLRGPIGIARLRKEYGGRKSKGSIGKHKSPGGGAIVRHALQQLERAGLVQTVVGKGRVLTSEGRSLLDRLSFEVKKQLEKSIPKLEKYG
jgi:small subunit ribosomal protein S19e